MSRWEEKLSDHAIHATVDWLEESVTQEFTDIEQGEISEKRRILKVIARIRETLEKFDAELIPFTVLDSLNKVLRHPQFSGQINSYSSNGNMAHLATANDWIENQIPVLSQIGGLTKFPSTKGSVKQLEELIDSTLDSLVTRKDKLTETLEQAQTSIDEDNQKLEALSTLIEQKSTEANSQISEWQNQFSSSQEARSQAFEKWRDEFSTEKNSKIDSVISNYSTSLDDKISSLDSHLESILEDSQRKHQSILDLYELTAGDSVGAGYIKNADTEKNQADTWRLVSVGFIILTIAWLFFAYISNSPQSAPFSAPTMEPISNNLALDEPEETSSQPVQSAQRVSSTYSEPIPWYRMLVTISLSGIMLWGSAYSGQQSTKHRNNEKRMRWFALEVKAFDPFISSLEPDQQNELKKELSARIFGQFSESGEDGTRVVDEHALKTVGDVISNILSKIPK